MRLYQLVIFASFLIGLARCCFVNVIIPPATTAIDQPEATADPTQPTTTSEEQSSRVSAEEQLQPTLPVALPESIQMQPRDVPQNLDYKCGPKWGKCPGGTCCSSAGKVPGQVC